MRRSSSYPYLIWMGIFIVIPLAIIVYYALTQTVDGQIVFTFSNIGKAFQSQYLMVLWRSIAMAFVATAICLVLGYPVAAIIASRGFKRAGTMLLLFILPMWMNFLLRTYALTYLLNDNGLIASLLSVFGVERINILYTQSAVVLGLVYNYLPFMILPIYTAISKMDHHLIEAAEDLGASSLQVFLKVKLPLSVPGIVTGITMVFMPAVTTFAISRLLGGSNTMMFGDLIEQQFLFMRDWHFGATLSLVMMILIIVSMVFLRKFDKDKEGGMMF